MNEIYQRGPVACGIAVPQALDDYTGGIFCDETGDMEIVHDISIVGYGEEQGQKYWMVRNSWGTHWGEDGFFRVCRGTNNIAIESDCAWATPKDTWTDPVWHQTTEEEKNDPRNDYTVYPWPQPEFDPSTNSTKEFEDSEFLGNSKLSGCDLSSPSSTFSMGEVKNSPYSWDLIPKEELPEGIDWRNKDGINWLSWNKN
jgi:cathepsin X